MWEFLFLVLGLVLLVYGAKYLVEGASSLAKLYNIPALVIGLTVVAFGTSMPEMIVNLFAAGVGSSGIAIGTIIGSNLANILLILGMTAMIYSIKVQKSTIWKEIPFSLLAAVVLLSLANDFILEGKISFLSRIDGIMLILFFVIFMYYTYELAIKREAREEISIKIYKPHIVALMILGGIIGLFIGGKFVVSSAVTIASNFGVSEFIISATIIAIGTSLPELITSVVAALNKKVDLAVGNVVGSNIFNIFLVLGVTSIVRPIAIPASLNFDLIFVIFVTALLFVFVLWGKKRRLNHWQGVILVLFYILYLIMIILRG